MSWWLWCAIVTQVVVTLVVGWLALAARRQIAEDGAKAVWRIWPTLALVVVTCIPVVNVAFTIVLWLGYRQYRAERLQSAELLQSARQYVYTVRDTTSRDTQERAEQ